jgi:hypothetical protein
MPLDISCVNGVNACHDYQRNNSPNSSKTFDGLVQRCSSLLTVEQLMDLSRRLQREASEYRQQAQREASQSLQADAESEQPDGQSGRD